MKNVLRKSLFVVLSALLLMLSVPTHAQGANVVSSTNNVTITLTANETLSLSCTPSAVSITAGSGTVHASSPVSCVTSWNLAATRTSINVYEYFTSPNPFGGSQINTGWVTAAVDGGADTTFATTSTTNATITGYFGPNVFSLSTISNFNSSHTDTVLLGINSSNLINAGTYTATLNIVAVAV